MPWLLMVIVTHCSLYPAMPRAEGMAWQMNDITARVFEAGIELGCK